MKAAKFTTSSAPRSGAVPAQDYCDAKNGGGTRKLRARNKQGTVTYIVQTANENNLQSKKSSERFAPQTPKENQISIDQRNIQMRIE